MICLCAALTAGCTGIVQGLSVIAAAPNTMVGEAAIRGRLGLHKGCIVTSSAVSTATVLLDPRVELNGDGTGIVDRATGETVAFGQSFRGGGSTLREDGQGWSISDIETYYRVIIPAQCPRDNVILIGRIKAA